MGGIIDFNQPFLFFDLFQASKLSLDWNSTSVTLLMSSDDGVFALKSDVLYLSSSQNERTARLVSWRKSVSSSQRSRTHLFRHRNVDAPMAWIIFKRISKDVFAL